MFIFTVAAALVITVFGVAGTAQAAEQSWHFNDTDPSDGVSACEVNACWAMNRTDAPGDATETTINAGDTHYWIADEAVQVGSIDFSDKPWTLDIQCTVPASVTGTVQVDIRLGAIDDGGFTEVAGAEADVGCEGGVLGESTEASLALDPSNSMVLNEGEYLAVELVNTGSNDALVTIGGDQDGDEYTVLRSHDDDPGYPVWEAASLLLLASGILGVAGYSRFKA